MFATSTINNHVTISEREVREEIIKDLKEWGVNPKYNEKHRTVWYKALEQAVADSKHNPSTLVPLEQLFTNSICLSRDYDEAICQVLRNELESSEYYTFLDADDVLNFGYQPFYHTFDRRARSTILCTKPELRRYTFREIDPFKRFKGIEYSSRDWFRKIWNPPSFEGYVFEALVASHMIYKMECNSCKCRNQLQWNGGIDKYGSWADVVCKHCMTSYEIKSVKSDDAFEKKLKYNSFRGGSFRQFYKNEAQFKSRYLVLVSRKETYVSTLNAVAHRVSLARIQKVEPRLCAESFVDTDKSYMRMISNVKINTISLKKAWCYVRPFFGYEAIAQEVFDDYYGIGAWYNERFEGNGKSESKTVVEKGPNASVDAVENLQEKLRKMLNADDVDHCDQETAYE